MYNINVSIFLEYLLVNEEKNNRFRFFFLEWGGGRWIKFIK